MVIATNYIHVTFNDALGWCREVGGRVYKDYKVAKYMYTYRCEACVRV